MNPKKLLNKKDLLLLSLIIIVFLLVRYINILKLPIFTDEAIYLRWAQIALHDSSWRFISLTDGKQPLFIWISLIFMKFLHNPLLSGRLVSVFSGLMGMIGSFFLGREIFHNKKIGYLSALFYLTSPFFLWYDRMALMDSLLAGFYVWSLYLEVILVRYLRLDIALLLGLTIGGAVLTKSSGFFAIYLLPLFLSLIDWKKGFGNLLKFGYLSFISIIIAYGFYGILRLSPWFYIINQKDHSFIYSFSDVVNNPFQYFFGNFKGLSIWWFGYFTLPFIILLLVSLLNKDKKTFFERIVLFLEFILPFTALAFFGKVLYPLFILFMNVSLLPLLAYALNLVLGKIKVKQFKYLILILVFIYPLYFDSQIILNLLNVPLPSSDRKQYLDDWPAGYGINEVITYLKQEKSRQPIFVATEGTFGLFPYALELEFFSDPSIKIQAYWPLPLYQKAINEAEGRPAYLLLKESQQLPSGWQAELINEYRRGRGETYLKFYRLIK